MRRLLQKLETAIEQDKLRARGWGGRSSSGSGSGSGSGAGVGEVGSGGAGAGDSGSGSSAAPASSSPTSSSTVSSAPTSKYAFASASASASASEGGQSALMARLMKRRTGAGKVFDRNGFVPPVNETTGVEVDTPDLSVMGSGGGSGGSGGGGAVTMSAATAAAMEELGIGGTASKEKQRPTVLSKASKAAGAKSRAKSAAKNEAKEEATSGGGDGGGGGGGYDGPTLASWPAVCAGAEAVRFTDKRGREVSVNPPNSVTDLDRAMATTLRVGGAEGAMHMSAVFDTIAPHRFAQITKGGGGAGKKKTGGGKAGAVSRALLNDSMTEDVFEAVVGHLGRRGELLAAGGEDGEGGGIGKSDAAVQMYGMLLGLSQVKRIGTLIMFLTAGEKAVLVGAAQALSEFAEGAGGAGTGAEGGVPFGGADVDRIAAKLK